MTRSAFFPNEIKDVIIIGAGPCGAGFTKSLLQDRSKYRSIRVFERRSVAGGLWNYDDVDEPLTLGPSTHAINPKNSNTGKYLWPTAAHKDLDTNIPYELMQYNTFKWTEKRRLFPTRSEVLKYFQTYSEAIEDYVEYNTSVVSVKQLDDLKWEVVVRPVSTETEGSLKQSFESGFEDRVFIADAVVIATGHYDIPRIPDFKGLKSWHQKYPGSIIHSKSFKSPEDYSAKDKILIIGNSASAVDIIVHLKSKWNTEIDIYNSIRSKNNDSSITIPGLTAVSEISQFNASEQSVEFKDGKRITGINKIIFATGFLRTFPFLEDINSSNKPLLKSGNRIHGLWRHILSYEYPGLAVAGVPKYGGPMALAEVQGAWLSRVFLGEIDLPSINLMNKWEKDREGKLGHDAPNFHFLLHPEDVSYYNMLVREVKESSNPSAEGIEYLSQYYSTVRANFKLIKKKYYDMISATGSMVYELEELQSKAPFKLSTFTPGPLDV
ncbi:N,N-dimethylaniline monooxygenase [Saccharomycopsis crataegensis]|uniref:N,N-dimethylaniline monooxygenase n=1 Tax=Saccharomycopsis crataegensis TaxID=43959 RepID=A0AAV5QG98_9ASCO|nr:N,N-dimethylaniline monooxygenase [Saccharomycopsis crataegensis]